MAELKHPIWPGEEQHLYSRWYPWGRGVIYRICVHPNCHHIQKMNTTA